MALQGIPLPDGMGLVSIKPRVYNPASFLLGLPGGTRQRVKKAVDRWRFEVVFPVLEEGVVGGFLDRLEASGEVVQIPLRDLPVPAGAQPWPVVGTAVVGRFSRVTVTPVAGQELPKTPEFVALGSPGGPQRTFRVASVNGAILDLSPRIDIPLTWTRLVAAAAVDCLLVPGAGDWGLRDANWHHRGRAVFEEVLAAG